MVLKDVQRAAWETRWRQRGHERGAGETGVTKNVRSVDQKIEVVSASTDLSLRSRWRINFLQTAQRPTGNMILQGLGHFSGRSKTAKYTGY